MKYDLYIFKSEHITGSWGFKSICRWIGRDEIDQCHNLLDFNAETLEQEFIEKTKLLALNAQPLAKFVVKYSQKHKAHWLHIVTSTSVAPQLIKILSEMALEHDLVLLDRQNANRTWRREDIFNLHFIEAANRKSKINEAICKALPGIYALRNIEDHERRGRHYVSYVITLRKIKNSNLEERTKALHDILCSALAGGETLECAEKYFAICGRKYTIHYCLEAYKKRSQWICHYENDNPKVELLNRQGVEFALRKGMDFDARRNLKTGHIWKRMNLDDLSYQYPNPADRFVASANIAKELTKMCPAPVYSSVTGARLDFSFNRPPDCDDDLSTVPRLVMSEEDVSFLLPIIEEFYPYAYELYYDRNPIPYVAWEKVIERMRQVAYLILHDTFNEALHKYIDRFDLYVLDDGYFDRIRDIFQEDKKRSMDLQFLYIHRKRVSRFYGFFMRWANNQGFRQVIEIYGP